MKAFTRFSLVLTLVLSPLLKAETVTFGDVFAEPNNVGLNLTYARQELTAQRFSSALSALDRVVALEPTLLEARLLRIKALVALDNATLAFNEIQGVLALPIPDSLRAELEAAQSDLRQSLASTHFSITAGVEWADQSNVTQYPTSGTVEISSQPGVFSEQVYLDSLRNNAPSDELVRTARLGFSMEHDFSTQNRDRVFALINAQQAEGADTDFPNYWFRSLTIGYARNQNNFDLRASAGVSSSQSDTNDDASQTNLDVSVSRAGLSLSLFNSAFKPIEPAETDSRDTSTRGAAISYGRALNSRTFARLDYSKNKTKADDRGLRARNRHDREAERFGLNVWVQLNAPVTLSASFSQTDTDYEGISFPNPRVREDTQKRTSLRLSLALGEFNPKLKNVSAQIGISRVENDSNIKVHTYDNDIASVGITYRHGWVQ